MSMLVMQKARQRFREANDAYNKAGGALLDAQRALEEATRAYDTAKAALCAARHALEEAALQADV